MPSPDSIYFELASSAALIAPALLFIWAWERAGRWLPRIVLGVCLAALWRPTTYALSDALLGMPGPFQDSLARLLAHLVIVGPAAGVILVGERLVRHLRAQD